VILDEILSEVADEMARAPSSPKTEEKTPSAPSPASPTVDDKTKPKWTDEKA
jgi:hypothetical protein